jgi:hypothetical protein
MIAELSHDLVNRINAVPGLIGKAGIVLGGGVIDPDLIQSPPPFAWVIFNADKAVEADRQGYGGQMGTVEFVVSIVVPYTNASDLYDVQFPMIEAVRKAIHAHQPEFGDNTAKWRYAGQVLKQFQQYKPALKYDQIYQIQTMY